MRAHSIMDTQQVVAILICKHSLLIFLCSFQPLLFDVLISITSNTRQRNPKTKKRLRLKTIQDLHNPKHLTYCRGHTHKRLRNKHRERVTFSPVSRTLGDFYKNLDMRAHSIVDSQEVVFILSSSFASIHFFFLRVLFLGITIWRVDKHQRFYFNQKIGIRKQRKR